MFKKQNKNKEKYEKLIKNIIKKSKYNIKEISLDWEAENIKPFNSYIRLAGLHISLRPNVTKDEDFEKISIYNQNIREKYENKEKEKDYSSSLEELEIIGANYGQLYFPYKTSRISEDKCKSNFLDSEYSYAPLLLEIPKLNEENVLKGISQYFNLSLKDYNKNKYKQMNVYIDKNNLTNQDIVKIYNSLNKIIKIYNEYIKKEFDELKENDNYKHRHDYNPDNF
jgi:hypothetical protein